MDNSYLDISEEIKIGLNKKKPIVALESTLISHGLPYPVNIKVAKSSIEAVRKNGSIPATIGIIKGRIKVGLSNQDIKILGKSKNVEKVSMHNLAIAINNKNHASTTVASTIYIASQLGIKFLSTGGIGGVHLNSENTYDTSADLIELSKTSMYVICSGAKSILDLKKTYEKLETLGIPKIGYKTEYIPGFWYYKTDNKVDYNYTKVTDLINYLKSRENIKQIGSVLLFNPIPKFIAINKEQVNNWIKNSIIKANKNLISGKDLTPYLIKEINLLSKNKTLDANIELIINNASVAGKIAKKYTTK